MGLSLVSVVVPTEAQIFQSARQAIKSTSIYADGHKLCEKNAERTRTSFVF
jgi:hypothetical protein